MKSGNKPGFKNMGSSSPALNMNGGSYKSPAKLRPSYINGEMVSDADANLEDAKNTYKASKGEETTSVTRKGQSKIKKVKADAKARKPGAKEKDALSKLDKEEIKEAEKYQNDPKNRAEQTKSWQLNNPGYKLVDGKKVKKTSPAKQRLTKGGEGKDQNKIFDDKGNHIGTYVNGKKVMKSTTSAHGQLDDAKREFDADVLQAKRKTTNPSSKPPKSKKSPTKMAPLIAMAGKAILGKVAGKVANKVMGEESPAKQTKFPNSSKALKRKQRDFVPAYPGGDYSKKDIAKMTEKQKAQKIDGYTPKKKSPAKIDLSKKSGFGPSTAFGGSKNKELVKDKKVKAKKVMQDGLKNKSVHKGKVVKGNWQPHQFRSPAKQVGVTVGGKKATDVNDSKKTRKEMKKAKKANTNAKTTKGKVKSSKDFYGSAF